MKGITHWAGLVFFTKNIYDPLCFCGPMDRFNGRVGRFVRRADGSVPFVIVRGRVDCMSCLVEEARRTR